MLTQLNASQCHENTPAPSADTACGPNLGEDEKGIKAPSNRKCLWAAPGAEVEDTSKFVQGVTLALPLSISLWAIIIWGLKLLF